MEIITNAESLELSSAGNRAVIVAEGLRFWYGASGDMLISRGPRLTASAPALGRLRTVPDRLGVVNGSAETHAVILAKNCRTEEMELTQKWSFDDHGALLAELEFIVPPACAGLELLGVEIDFPGELPAFSVDVSNGRCEKISGTDGGVLAVFLPDSPVRAGIHRINITFISEISPK